MKCHILSFLMLLALTGCKDSNGSNFEMDSPMRLTEEVKYQAMEVAAADGVMAAPVGTYEQKIIKNAHLRFETADLDATAQKIQDAIKKHKAQLQNDVETKDSYILERSITVRIPAQQFDAFIADIGKGVSYFDRKEISSQDVTEEYIDISARLKAKKVLEARYLELLKKASKVSEMLEIEKQLSAIREEIEAQEGRLRYIQDRVALSTVYIAFYKSTEHSGGATVSYGSKMGNAFKSGFNALSTFFLALLYMWPFILIFVVAFIIIRKKIRKRKKP